MLVCAEMITPLNGSAKGWFPPPDRRTGYSSAHAGGAFFLIGDGSVRFVNDNVNQALYINLGAINDGNAIP